MIQASADLIRALAFMESAPARLPLEPAAAAILSDPAAIQFFQMRRALKQRNRWPTLEKLCECGKLYPARKGARGCADCRTTKDPAGR